MQNILKGKPLDRKTNTISTVYDVGLYYRQMTNAILHTSYFCGRNYLYLELNSLQVTAG